MTRSLSQGEVVYEAGAEVDHIYFPHNGMFSLLAVMRDGKAIETATVGREGVVGAMAGLGLYKSLVRVIVQLPLGQQNRCGSIQKSGWRQPSASRRLRSLQRDHVNTSPHHRRLQCTASDRRAFLPLAATIRRSHRKRYGLPDPRTAGGDAWRPQDLRNGGRAKDARQRRDYIYARRHQNFGP